MRLAWTTASETDNAGFYVEHRREGGWADLGFVEGAGTTAEAQRYAFRATALEAGTHRFRLRQVDRDGTEHLSAEVELAVGQRGALSVEAGPNPFAQRAEVAVDLAPGRRARLQDIFEADRARLRDFVPDRLCDWILS